MRAKARTASPECSRRSLPPRHVRARGSWPAFGSAGTERETPWASMSGWLQTSVSGLVGARSASLLS